tara:strand:+ start:97 stop:291 length:195 start_codon:yes stop_codon:yes gene_type:complete
MTKPVGESGSLKRNKSSTEELRVWNQIQWKIIVEKWKQQEEPRKQKEEIKEILDAKIIIQNKRE